MATQVQSENSQLLRHALTANAIFSSISGLGFVLFSGQVAEFLGIEATSILGLFDGQTFVLVIGIGLLLFALGLFVDVRQDEIDPAHAMVTIGMDMAWVVGSAVILITGALPFTTAGSWAVLIVADIVALFAIVQYVGLRRIQS